MVPVGLVLELSHAGDGLTVNAFHADVDMEQAAALCQVQELLVVTKVHRPKGGPAQAKGNNGFHQFHRVAAFDSKIAFGKEDIARGHALDFLDHILDRPDAKPTTQIEPLGAKLAGEWAAS